MDEWTSVLIGLLGTLIGASPAVIIALLNRGKTQAEGAGILSAAYVGLVQPQGQVIDRLKSELAAAAAELDDKDAELGTMQRRLTKALACAQALYYMAVARGLKTPCKPEGVTGPLADQGQPKPGDEHGNPTETTPAD